MTTKHKTGSLWLAQQMGDDPNAYTISQLQDAIPRLLAAKHRSRSSQRAMDRADRRIDAIRAMIAYRSGE